MKEVLMEAREARVVPREVRVVPREPRVDPREAPVELPLASTPPTERRTFMRSSQKKESHDPGLQVYQQKGGKAKYGKKEHKSESPPGSNEDPDHFFYN